MRQILAFLSLILMASGSSQAELTYQKPPQAVLDVLNTPPAPTASVSPVRTHIMLIQSERYPSIAVVSEPMLRLAGLRISPQNNGLHSTPHAISLTLQRISDGAETKIALPPAPKIVSFRWSADGKRFAFSNTVKTGIELWVGETATGKVHKLAGVVVNGVAEPTRMGGVETFQWMPDNRTLFVRTVPTGRGKVPVEPTVPTGPHIQESAGKAGPVRTYQDLLTGPHDENLFDYYATAQIALVDTVTGKVTPVGKPGVFAVADPSPDGAYFLMARIHRPYSYVHTAMSFPKDVELWDRTGKPVYTLAKLPLEDSVPIEGVAKGPRGYTWRPTEPATLYWVQALDGGDPKTKVPHRDVILTLKAPFQGSPAEISKTVNRCMGVQWLEKGGLAIVRDYERSRRWITSVLLNADNPAEAPRTLWSRSSQDRYNDSGMPVTRTLPSGQRAILQRGDDIFLEGSGATPKGDRPFLRRFNLKTGKAEEIFRCDDKTYETVVALLEEDGSKFLTRRESPTEPPNYVVRSAGPAKVLTNFKDPTPQLRAIKKQRVTYKRADGVQLSFTLYLPPDYKEGTRLPTVVWAYPVEFNDADTAGQVGGSTQRFTTIYGMSHLFFLLQGYAILDGASMPVVGSPDKMNDTYIEQIVASAKAAIDKAAEMGVTDPKRVGVGGHSYGAFMTANLLAHCDLFRAGIARSGAYNRTLTPFGFQSERRTLWEAPEVYLKMSPFMYADKLKNPILLVHGEADNNPGTFPIQSDRMYQAIRGNGGKVRYVTLPNESHGYGARESIEHTLWEMISWFDKYVKNAE